MFLNSTLRELWYLLINHVNFLECDLFYYFIKSDIISASGGGGSSLPGLRTLDPPLGPPSTLEEIFQHTGGGLNIFFLPEFLFILVRSPCKNLKPYDNPFWEFSNGGKSEKINYQK